MRSAEIKVSPMSDDIKTLRWEGGSIAAFFERLRSEDAKDVSKYVSTDLEAITEALIGYIQTVIEIITPVGTTNTSFRGKMQKAPIVTEVIYGTEVLKRLRMLKTDDSQIRYGLCLLLRYILCSKDDVQSSTIIEKIKNSITEEHIAWLKRALHTEVQFAVLKCSHLHSSVKMLRPNGDRLLSKLNPCVSCAQTPLILQVEKNSTFSYVEPDEDLSHKMHEHLSMNYSGDSKINQVIDNYRKGTLGKMVWKPLEQTFVDYGKFLASKYGLKEKRVSVPKKATEYQWGGANKEIVTNLEALLSRNKTEDDNAFSDRVFSILGNSDLNSPTANFLLKYDGVSKIFDVLKNVYQDNDWKKTVGIITQLQREIRKIKSLPVPEEE
jgi:hypothetical protein